MRRIRTAILLAALIAAGPALGQVIATSAAPDRVSVTVYRDPHRQPATRPNLRWMNGYALISETRSISLPAGEAEIRFEGVAGGIIPQSAIVSGFPEGIVERNRDAYLLSPGTLLDRSLGRRVHLRRTSLATGAVREQDAVIRSGADGAVVLETEAGIEALRCTGLAETLIFDDVPAGLSVRPTLSVRARSSRPVEATITLSYLATNFDWQANYVATLSPAGDRVDLFAWMTLANGDETSFAEAEALAVAGRLNREDNRPQPVEGPPLRLQCWPSATTSDIAQEEDQTLDALGRGRSGPPPPPPPPPPPAMAAESVVVTGTLIRAQQEDLGDVKLYRIPERVTIAARSQKQVAMIERAGVRAAFVYRQTLSADDPFVDQAATRVLVTRNRAAEGLGVPLPAGRLVLFELDGGRPLLVGEGHLADRAVGEDVEIELGEVPGIVSSLRRLGGSDADSNWELTVSSDRPYPVAYEADIFEQGGHSVTSASRLGRRDGRPLWTVTIPANGQARLVYRLRANS
jgi:hypothetical protein